MAIQRHESLCRFAHFLSLFSIVVFFSPYYLPAAHSLKIGLQFLTDTSTIPESIADHVEIEWSKSCNKECRSEFCSVAPLLRYGKYCEVSYGGCPGEKPCDALDRCCMKLDVCVGKNSDGCGDNGAYEYRSQECNQNLLGCMENVKKTGGYTFEGNRCNVTQVIDAVTPSIEAALLAGKALHKP